MTPLKPGETPSERSAGELVLTVIAIAIYIPLLVGAIVFGLFGIVIIGSSLWVVIALCATLVTRRVGLHDRSPTLAGALSAGVATVAVVSALYLLRGAIHPKLDWSNLLGFLTHV
jgi:hypothetical protein